MKPERVGIVGAGQMGSGIAQKFAMQGVPVLLIDRSPEILDRALRQIEENLGTLVEGQYCSREVADLVLPRVSARTGIEALEDSRFVLESVTEDLDLKRRIFAQLDEICPADAILASNTSGLAISRLAAATRRPERVIGCHWINPPYLIPLVEVVRGDLTSPQTVADCVGMLRSLGVVPAVCQRDVPGFVINRLQWVIQSEALDLVERQIVSMEDLDNIVQLGLGARLALYGPFRINDLAADKTLTLKGFEYMFRETGDPRFRPSRLLREKVAEGALGIRTGRGWYDYAGKAFKELRRERDLAFTSIVKFLRSKGFHPDT